MINKCSKMVLVIFLMVLLSVTVMGCGVYDSADGDDVMDENEQLLQQVEQESE